MDVDLRAARAFTAHRLLRLGPTHRGLLLSHAARFDEGLDDQFWFAYDDCGRPRAATCPRGSVQVESRPQVSRRSAGRWYGRADGFRPGPANAPGS